MTELVRRCDFGDKADELLRDRIVCGIVDNTTRKQMLQKKSLTLQSCVDICRASEATSRQLKVMGGEDKVHWMNQKPKRNTAKPKEEV